MKLDDLSPLSKMDENSNDEELNKIELLGCPFGGKNCRKHLAAINKSYLDSVRHQREKNYLQAIEQLKLAYEKTDEIQQSSCLKCAALFRTTITDSLKNIHKELQKMTTGIFRNKRYEEVYNVAGHVLREWEQNN